MTVPLIPDDYLRTGAPRRSCSASITESRSNPLVSGISRRTPIPGQTPEPASWFVVPRSEVIHTFYLWFGFDPAEMKRSAIMIRPFHTSLVPTRIGW